MFTLARLGLNIVIFVLLLGTRADAQVPSSISSSLIRHEQQLDGYTIGWQLSEVDEKSAPSQEVVTDTTAATIQEATEQAQIRGIKDSFTTQATCVIQRKKNKELVQDKLSIQQQSPPANVNIANAYYYSNNLGMYADTAGSIDFTSSDLRQVQATLSGYVWLSNGDSARNEPPASQYLPLQPEDQSLLGGLNVLNIRNTHWKVISSSPSACVLSGAVTQGSHAPFSIILTLDPVHDYLPSKIIETDGIAPAGHGWTRTYIVGPFITRRGICLPSSVTSTLTIPSLEVNTRKWTLDSVAPVSNIQLSITPGTLFTDYRLLGDTLTTGSLHKANLVHDPGIISYTWPGFLPSMNQLKQMQNSKTQ